MCSLTEPDPFDGDEAVKGYVSTMEAIWSPDYTMAVRVRQTLGRWLARHSRVTVTPLKGDPVQTKRKFDYYTGQSLAELSQDIGDPTKYREKQVIARLCIHIANDVRRSVLWHLCTGSR